jgi:NADPH:quinone reductase-like Zn-dependent oxidoreductase
MIAQGTIAPEIAALVPSREVARVHRMMEQRSTTGRVVLQDEADGTP